MKIFAYLVLTAVALVGLTRADQAAAAERYHTVKPCIGFNSLTGAGGQPNTLLVGAENKWFNLRGKCDVPLDAKAVAVVVTVIGPGGGPTQHAGNLNIFDAGLSLDGSNPIEDPDPSGLPIPNTSVVNWTGGEKTVANFAVISFISGSKAVKVWAGYGPSAAGVHVAVDVLGYFK